MKKNKIIIGIDLGSYKGDYKSMTVFKVLKDKSIDIMESITTQDSKLFEEKKKELENLYPTAFLLAAAEVNQYSITPSKKSRKTKDIKSFKSSDYEMFKNGSFNCDNIPYGYNFLLGKCMEPVTFEPKRKER